MKHEHGTFSFTSCMSFNVEHHSHYVINLGTMGYELIFTLTTLEYHHRLKTNSKLNQNQLVDGMNS